MIVDTVWKIGGPEMQKRNLSNTAKEIYKNWK